MVSKGIRAWAISSSLPGTLGRVGTVETVLQLDYGNGGEQDVRPAVNLRKRGKQLTDGFGITLGGD
jgi:hypothetical protein